MENILNNVINVNQAERTRRHDVFKEVCVIKTHSYLKMGLFKSCCAGLLIIHFSLVKK